MGRHSQTTIANVLGFAFGLAQAGDAVAWFPLPAFFEQFNALDALQDVTFAAQSGSGPKTTVL